MTFQSQARVVMARQTVVLLHTRVILSKEGNTSCTKSLPRTKVVARELLSRPETKNKLYMSKPCLTFDSKAGCLWSKHRKIGTSHSKSAGYVNFKWRECCSGIEIVTHNSRLRPRPNLTKKWQLRLHDHRSCAEAPVELCIHATANARLLA